MSDIEKTQALAIKLDSFSTDRCRIDVSPDDVLAKVSGEDELNFYYTMLCFGGVI
jgi:hypothetical protein